MECGWRCSSQPNSCTEIIKMPMTVANRRYRNFAPFVRQTGERKAQTCAIRIFATVTPSFGCPRAPELPFWLASSQRCTANQAPQHQICFGTNKLRSREKAT